MWGVFKVPDDYEDSVLIGIWPLFSEANEVKRFLASHDVLCEVLNVNRTLASTE